MEFEYKGKTYSVPYSAEAIAQAGRNYHIYLPEGQCIRVSEWYLTSPPKPASFCDTLPVGLKVEASHGG